MDHVGLDKDFVVTFGFALNANYFFSAFQPDSKFRYLGEQKICSRDTYVVDRGRPQTYELAFQNEHRYSDYRRYWVSLRKDGPSPIAGGVADR